MRCLTLANVLRQRGKECHFLCRFLPEHLWSTITSMGHKLHHLPDAPQSMDANGYGIWLGTSPQTDAEQVAELLGKLKPEWLVVDHYALDFTWELRQRSHAGQILVIDDLANRHHECDLLLDQNLRDDNPYIHLIPTSARVLLGPHFALLRPEFRQLRVNCRGRDGGVRRLVVSLGGSDPKGDTLKVVMALSRLSPSIETDVIVGKMNPNCEAIRSYCQRYPFLHFSCEVNDMAARLAKADLAIGGGGTTSWERLAVGLPTLVIEQADNQTENICQLEKYGVAVCLGRSSSLSSEKILEQVKAFLQDDERLHRMSVRALGMVDAEGAWRSASAMGVMS